MMRGLSTARRARLDLSQIARRSTRCISSTPLAQQVHPGPSPAAQKPAYRPVPDNRVTNLINQAAKAKLLEGTAEPYQAYSSTALLFKTCLEQADYTMPSALKNEPPPKNEAGEDVGEGYGIWFMPKPAGLGLPVTFMTWAQIMFVYMYVLTVKLREFPAEHVRVWEQHLLDHFCYAAEEKMAKCHGMAAKGTRNKNLKDLWMQWRGVILSYDEGLIKGDAAMGAAIWRSIFKADPEADVADVARVTAYMRKELHNIGQASNRDVSSGKVVFGALNE